MRGMITDVSDTALWIAAIRANEGARDDAVFRDPLASILAGERGRRIARSFSRSAMMAWGVVARTSAIDRLINESLSNGVDTVINLGAGMDTRPYRMVLPPQVRWIEVDFPNIVAAKTDSLREHTPACGLERVGMDLLDRSSLGELLVRCTAQSKSTLIITEGVISYFSNDDAAAFARDLYAAPSVRFWIQDFDNAGQRRLPRGWERKLKAAPFLLNVKDWFEFFGTTGWKSHRIITNIEEAERIHRPYPVDFPFGLILRALPRDMRTKILGLSGAVLLDKGANPVAPAGRSNSNRATQ
jgi:methyltransferase (TIGR00027 family)